MRNFYLLSLVTLLLVGCSTKDDLAAYEKFSTCIESNAQMISESWDAVYNAILVPAEQYDAETFYSEVHMHSEEIVNSVDEMTSCEKSDFTKENAKKADEVYYKFHEAGMAYTDALLIKNLYYDPLKNKEVLSKVLEGDVAIRDGYTLLSELGNSILKNNN